MVRHRAVVYALGEKMGPRGLKRRQSQIVMVVNSQLVRRLKKYLITRFSILIGQVVGYELEIYNSGHNMKPILYHLGEKICPRGHKRMR